MMYCNAEGTVTYGEGPCTSAEGNCGCKNIMQMGPGCYVPMQMPGTTWFVMSEGCSCPDDMMTCGKVKAMYKDAGCCGNPSHPFKGMRRLQAKTGTDDTAVLLSDIKAVLEQ